MATTQVAVRMEQELLERLDWIVARCSFENRAEAIRAAIERLAEQERDREIGEQIAEGYRRIPPTDEENAWSRNNYWTEDAEDDWETLL